VHCSQQYSGDDTWVRLLDVPAALCARGYATPGSVVLEVVDDSVGGYAAGRYLFDAGPDELSPGALRRFDAMLATPSRPWNATGF
jgi:hypothetical protein